MRVQVYRSYRFVDKDPVIDAIRTVVQDVGLKHGTVAVLAGVAPTTLQNWFVGSTRRPNNATVTAVSAALGYVRQDTLDARGVVRVGYRKVRDLDFEAQRKMADRWLVKHGHKPKRKRKAEAKTNGAQA